MCYLPSIHDLYTIYGNFYLKNDVFDYVELSGCTKLCIVESPNFDRNHKVERKQTNTSQYHL